MLDVSSTILVTGQTTEKKDGGLLSKRNRRNSFKNHGPSGAKKYSKNFDIVTDLYG